MDCMQVWEDGRNWRVELIPRWQTDNKERNLETVNDKKIVVDYNYFGTSVGSKANNDKCRTHTY